MVALSGGAGLDAALAKIAANLSKSASVSVGFQNGATEADGTSVALVAALSEFGTSRMPPRPFFRTAINENSHKWPVNIATALRNNDYDSAKALGLVGLEIKEEIEQSIIDIKEPPLKPATIKRKGFDKLLVETGTLLHSVTSVVK